MGGGMGRLPGRDVKLDIYLSFFFFFFLSNEGPMLETLDYTIRISSTPTFLYFDLYLYSAYAAHFVYLSFVPLRLYGKEFAGRFSSRPGKAGSRFAQPGSRFLSFKHSVPLCWDAVLC